MEQRGRRAPRLLEAVILAYACAVVAFAFYIAKNHSRATWLRLISREGGIVEVSTVVLLLICTACWLYYFIKQPRGTPLGFRLVLLMFAVVTAIFVGEELSWGQHVFGFETPDWFGAHNRQRELNLHNLELGRLRLDSAPLYIIVVGLFVLYLVAIPLAARRVGFARWLHRIGLPCPRWYLAAFFVVLVTFTVVFLQVDRGFGEIVELVEAAMMAAVTVHPKTPYLPRADARLDRQAA